MSDLDDTPREVFEVVDEDPKERATAELDVRSATLAAALRRAVPFLFRGGHPVTADAAEATTLAALEEELGTPRHVLPLRIEPDGVAAALLCDAAAVAFLLDGALGGDGSSPPTLTPEGLTGPQRALLQRVIAGIVPGFSATLEAGLGLTLRRPTPPDEPLPKDVTALRFRLGEGGVGGCVALALGRQAMLAAASPARRSSASDPILTAALGAVEIEIVVELGRLRLTLGEVASLRVGDVLGLPTPVGSAVNVRTDGRMLFRGHPTTSGTHVAVRVSDGMRLEGALSAAMQGGGPP